MSQTHQAKSLLIGLPESGKSTFIAALWEVVRSFTVEGAMHFAGLEGDDRYINQIHASWVVGKPLERTKVKRSIPVRLKLTHPSRPGETTELVLPDLDGEYIKRQWTKREWTADYESNLNDACGILFFVSAKNLREGTLIDPTLQQLAKLIPNAATQPGPSTGQVKESTIDFDPEKVPTQTILVELLQFILRWMPEPRLVKLAVIISAWDVAEEKAPDQMPRPWLDEKLPLLSQFLRSNSESFDVRVYGISAQGCEWDEKGMNEEMKAKVTKVKRDPNPSNRIKVVLDKDLGHDITLPLQWLMIDQ
jgi:hypothetical protein